MTQSAFADGDAAANMLERRWFAAQKAARAARSECDVLREVIEQAECAWQLARSRLDAFEKLRDALDEHLNKVSEEKSEQTPRPKVHAVMSAA